MQTLQIPETTIIDLSTPLRKKLYDYILNKPEKLGRFIRKSKNPAYVKSVLSDMIPFDFAIEIDTANYVLEKKYMNNNQCGNWCSAECETYAISEKLYFKGLKFGRLIQRGHMHEHKARFAGYPQINGFKKFISIFYQNADLAEQGGTHLHIDIGVPLYSVLQNDVDRSLLYSRFIKSFFERYKNVNTGIFNGYNDYDSKYFKLNDNKTIEFRGLPSTFNYRFLVHYMLECQVLVKYLRLYCYTEYKNVPHYIFSVNYKYRNPSAKRKSLIQKIYKS